MWQHFQPYIEDKDLSVPHGTMKKVLPHFPGRSGPVIRAKMQAMQRDFAKGKIRFPKARQGNGQDGSSEKGKGKGKGKGKSKGK